jgi:excisionase family DNA binding protein
LSDTAPETGQAEQWLTIKEASRYLKVSQQTIFRWMRSGKLSFFKIGNATRFRRSNLDMLAEKITGEAEGEHASAKCVSCGHSHLIDGVIRSTGRIYFQPSRTRFFLLMDSWTRVRARTCPVCGHIQLFADTEKLGRLLPTENGNGSQGG